MAVVDALGARPSGQASSTLPSFSTTSACRPSALPACDVTAITGCPSFFSTLSIRRISSLSPLYDSMMTTSPLRTDPRSPCIASAGLRKWLGVPVLLNDAESFRAT